MKPDESQLLRAYKAHTEQMPPGKWRKKVWKALGGIAVAALATLGVVYYDKAPWQAYAVMYAFAGYCISPDTVTGAAKFFAAAIRDLVNAFKGNGK